MAKPIPANATLEQRLVNCGNARCQRCRGGRASHGPYWYAYWKDGAKLRTRYVGVEISKAQFDAKRERARQRTKGPSEERAIATVNRFAKRGRGLAFVPDVVRALGGAAIAHPLLMRLAREERLELRPESGLARLTKNQLALCLPGPQGSRLSWARSMS